MFQDIIAPYSRAVASFLANADRPTVPSCTPLNASGAPVLAPVPAPALAPGLARPVLAPAPAPSNATAGAPALAAAQIAVAPAVAAQVCTSAQLRVLGFLGFFSWLPPRSHASYTCDGRRRSLIRSLRVRIR